MTSKNILENNKNSNLFLGKVYNQFNYDAPLQPINHQKNIFTVNGIQGPYVTDSIYNRRFVFEIPKNIGYISELYIQTTITCTGDNSTIQDRLGSRVYKDIYLQTLKGPNIIQHIRPDYTNARTDLMTFKQLILSSMEPDTTFNNTTVNVYTPLFISTGFDTNFVEPLQISAKINDSYTTMGLSSNTITAITAKLYIVSHTIESCLRKSYRMISYNVFYEEPVAITTSSTSTKTFIECDKQVSAVHMVIRSTGQEYFRINSFQLTSNDLDIVPIMPSVLNNNNCDIGMTYSYYFNSTKDRLSLAGLNLDDLDPLELTVNYNTIGAGYSLYIFFEYSTVINISPLGSISMIF